MHDHRLGIGDQKAFPGAVEHRGGLAQVVFVAALVGDVAVDTGQAQGAAVFGAGQATAAADPAIAAVAVADAVDALQVGAQALDAVLVEGEDARAVVRVQAVLPEQQVIAQVLQGQADQVGIAGRVVDALGFQVPVPDAVLDHREGAAQALFAVGQRGKGGVLPAKVPPEQKEQQQEGNREEDVLLQLQCPRQRGRVAQDIL